MKNVAYWWVFFWTQVTCVGVAWYFNVIQQMWAADVSYISAGILFLWLIGTINIGVKTHDAYKTTTSEPIFAEYLAYACSAFGMVGTLVGFIVLVGGSIDVMGDDVTPQQLKLMLATLTSGIGTAVWTTLAGIVATICLTFQLNNLQILVNTRAATGVKSTVVLLED